MNKLMKLENKIVDEYSNIAGIVILKNGEFVYENYFNSCTSNNKIHVFSVTKSIVSILVGIAIDKGYIKSVNQRVLEFFPNYKVRKNERNIQNITIKDLLTMSAPYKFKFNKYIKYFTSEDYVKFSLDLLGGRGTIGNFKYTPLIGPDILSGILLKATEQSVFEFAQKYLFKPLEIEIKDNIVFNSKEELLTFYQAKDYSCWVGDQNGNNTAGWGLTLSSLDMAKIGGLYLNDGLYNETRIVSSRWINESIKEHNRWDKIKISYGYLWWVFDKEKKIYAAMGDGGNTIYINTSKQLVVAISSLFEKKAKDRIDFINNHIEPLFDS